MSDHALPVLDEVTTTGDDAAGAPSDPAAAPASEVHVEPLGPRFVFSTVARKGTILYVALVVPLLTIVLWEQRAPYEYLRGMLAASLFFAVPGLIAAVIAALRAPSSDRLVRWTWASIFIAGVAITAATRDRLVPGMDPPVARTTVPVVVTLVLLVVANTLILRARSGQRAALVDAVDIVMATAALMSPLALAFGHAILEAERSWFTAASGLWVVVACHGTLVALVTRARIERGYRTMADVGVIFGFASMASAGAHVVLGTQEFSLPAGPFYGLFALASGLGLLFFVHATSEASPGLERLAPGDQVRRHSLIAILVLGSVPVIGAVAWWRHHEPWVAGAGLVAVLTMLILSSIRHLLAARETVRLYGLVEESSRQRGELLAEVMAHVDTDRHRAAAHLHRQAASLYAAMASFTSALDQAVESGDPSSVTFAAERMRRDLGARADGLRRLAEAVKPLSPPDHEESRRLAAPMRAYLANVCGDGPRPELSIDVDPQLALDWTTEAAVLRIVQEATVNAWWYAGATHVSVTVSATGCDVAVEVVDDGHGSTPPNVVVSSMQSVARFLGGDIVIERSEEGGRVSAILPVGLPIPDEARHHLRLVIDHSAT